MGPNAVAQQSTSAQNQTPTANPVDQAVSSIKESLSTSLTDWAVSHNDVRNIASTFEGLNANQSAAVIDELAKDGTLDTMSAEMSDNFNGLSLDEKAAFFSDMATKLDGQTLATLSNSFAKADPKSGGHQDVEALGKAVATHATVDTKVDFIEALMPKMTDKPDFSISYIGGSMTQTGDAEALAVGHVLGSLQNNPAQAENIFNQLSTEQLNAVINAGLDQTSSFSQGGGSVSLDATVAGKVLNTASQIGNADLKATIFDAGSAALQHVNDDFGFPLATIGQNAAADTLGDGLTRIIDSDTTGVMRELSYNQQTFDGTAFGTYAKHMLNTDQTDKLGEQMAKLQFGNNLNEDPVSRFEQTVSLSTGSLRNENAGALGHFVAGVYNGAASISSDVKQQQELTTSVLKSVLTIVDKAKIGGPLVGGAASVGKEWVKYAVNAAISDPGNDAAKQMELAAIPIDPSTNEIGIGDAAMSAFNDRITQTQRLANP